MLGKCVELLVNLPGQTKGNIGEVVAVLDKWDLISLEMIDGSILTCMTGDVKPL